MHYNVLGTSTLLTFGDFNDFIDSYTHRYKNEQLSPHVQCKEK